ncbi:MAG: hypothetical protein IPN44_15760 [Flavobacteriales bacterium]|nr:hypothetical protein [Flavobacteriales bacterium]
MSVCKFLTLALAVTLVALLPACNGPAGEPSVNADADSLSVKPNSNGQLLNVQGKLFSIPSPVQTALLIKKANLPYRQMLPLNTDSLQRFTSKEKRALALGMYGADLAYRTVYKDGQAAIRSLKAIEQLSNQLNLGNAFDKDLMEGFIRNLSVEDSLLRFSGKAYRSADRYLKTDKQEDVSASVLAGGWVEGLYLSLGDATDKLDPKVATRLAEQQNTLTNLIGLLVQADTQPALVKQLQELKAALGGVKVTYVFVKPTLDVAKKTTYINSATSAEVPPETLQAIITKIREIRSSIIA